MTELVGILNVTPDSFSDGGTWNESSAAIGRAKTLLAEGAAYVDIGAESTRPGAEPLRPDEEWRRLEPVLGGLAASGLRFSIDTYHPQTVERGKALFDDFIVNDVTGLHDPAMQAAVARFGLRCIASHLPAAAHGDIQAAHKKEQHVTTEQQVVDELGEKIELLVTRGIRRANIIVDPGIGFGKTPELNVRLLEFAKHFPQHETMIGYSRKRFLGEQRMELAPNLAAGRVAVASGAAYLRVHDVAGHKQLLGA